jgi:Acyl-CoA synthetases (AMP-forming)/AMP-acid ligases II
VYPAEIESALYEHPSVEAAAVIGVPDDEWGEVGAAFVVLDDDRSSGAVTEHCREHLADYKVPKHVRILDELPLGDSGKVDRAALHDAFDPSETT